MGCALRKFRKMEQKIIDLENEKDELMAEIEALKTSAIVDAHAPQGQIYQWTVNQVIFKGNSPSDVKKFRQKFESPHLSRSR